MLDELAKKYALLKGDFVLSSGKRSSYYFDGRLLTLHPQGLYLITKEFLKEMRKEDAQSVGGPIIGAAPIVSGICLLSHLEGKPVYGFLVRKEPKSHGTRKLIEGHIKGRVAIVDDVITTGGSILRAIDICEEAGGEVVLVMTVLDRLEGGSEEIKRRGYKFKSLLVMEGEEIKPLGT